MADELTAIEFDNTIDDLTKFNAYHLRSPAGASLRRMQLVVMLLVTIAIATLAAVVTGRLFYFGIIPFAFGASYLVRPWLLDRTVRATVKMQLASANTGGLIGWHKLTLEEDALREDCTTGSMSSTYSTIDKIAETDDMVYVYVNALQAHVIPRANVPADELSKFLEELREKIDT